MSRSTSSQDGLLQFTTADDCTSSSISDMQSSLNSESSTLERKLQEAIALHAIAGLTPDNASDLIFLKGAWSLVESHIIRKRAAETDAAAAAAEAV